MSAASATTVPDAYTVYIEPPAQAGSLTITNKWALGVNGNLHVIGSIKFAGTNSTGAGTASLSTNCPAVTATAPYTWLTAISSDGSTVYIPCWK